MLCTKKVLNIKELQGGYVMVILKTTVGGGF